MYKEKSVSRCLSKWQETYPRSTSRFLTRLKGWRARAGTKEPSPHANHLTRPTATALSWVTAEDLVGGWLEIITWKLVLTNVISWKMILSLSQSLFMQSHGRDLSLV